MRAILGLSLTFALIGVSAAQDDAAKKELAKFAGSWRLVAIEIDGKRNELQEANQTVYVLKGKEATYLDKAGKSHEWATLTIDPKTTPRIVDLEIKEKKLKWEGIYKVEGDDAWICANISAEGTKERPAEFSTANKFGHVIMFFKKVPN